MQSLLLAPHLVAPTLSGAKTHTIRLQEARIVPGPLELRDAQDPMRRVIVEVRRCTDMPLREAAAFTGHTDEWPDAVMLAGMRTHYPAIALDDAVQVIEFDGARLAAP